MGAIKQAVDLGYKGFQKIQTDPDLENLRKATEFKMWFQATPELRENLQTGGLGHSRFIEISLTLPFSPMARALLPSRMDDNLEPMQSFLQPRSKK